MPSLTMATPDPTLEYSLNSMAPSTPVSPLHSTLDTKMGYTLAPDTLRRASNQKPGRGKRNRERTREGLRWRRNAIGKARTRSRRERITSTTLFGFATAQRMSQTGVTKAKANANAAASAELTSVPTTQTSLKADALNGASLVFVASHAGHHYHSRNVRLRNFRRLPRRRVLGGGEARLWRSHPPVAALFLATISPGKTFPLHDIVLDTLPYLVLCFLKSRSLSHYIHRPSFSFGQ
ncbi:hypothetical protein NMY22_g4737 [Coprinellus aureogranulatus]|nr:hypothetical protein NMY22_g4737 [Coprinellus aureogranulatus]